MIKLFTESVPLLFRKGILTGFPLNNFCVNHEVMGFFLNWKYAHKYLASMSGKYTLKTCCSFTRL